MALDTMAAELGMLSSESSFSGAPTDASSNPVSLSPTPPTTVSPDNMSLASDPEISKPDTISIPPILAAAIPMLESAASQQLQQVETETADSDVGLQISVAQAIVVAEAPPTVEEPSTRRPRRARLSEPVYKESALAGTDIHGKRRAKGDIVADKKQRRTTLAGTLPSQSDAAAESAEPSGSTSAADASELNVSVSAADTPKGSASTKKKGKSVATPPTITRRATRLSGAATEIAATITSLGKRSRKTLEKEASRLTRELRRLQDTNEFAHIDTRPVVNSYWVNGKYVDARELEQREQERQKAESAEPTSAPPRKKARTTSSPAPVQQEQEQKDDTPEEAPPVLSAVVNKRRVKKWLDKGLYAGQEAPTDHTKGLTTAEKKKLASIKELSSEWKPNKTLPLPMYNGVRMLLTGRDFVLPFDVCHPQPPPKPAPTAYRTMQKNRFIGEARAVWNRKKSRHFESFSSKCVCKIEDGGCGESCQNRIMLYECDESNCNVGEAHCQNRAFATLQERKEKGGRYRVGVEVFNTGDRGFGVRANRCFEANQIIMEYVGEIITEEECERRMNEEYKNNEVSLWELP